MLVRYIKQVDHGVGCPPFHHHLVQRAGTQRHDPCDRMAVVGYLDRLATDDAFEYRARLLPKLPDAYSVTHGVHTVAQFPRWGRPDREYVSGARSYRGGEMTDTDRNENEKDAEAGGEGNGDEHSHDESHAHEHEHEGSQHEHAHTDHEHEHVRHEHGHTHKDVTHTHEHVHQADVTDDHEHPHD